MSSVNSSLPTPVAHAPATWDFDTGVQYLIRHIPSGTYYVRARVDGRQVRRTTGTTAFAEAKRRLPGILTAIRDHQPPEVTQASRQAAARAEAPWLPAVFVYRRRLASDPTLSQRTVKYRHDCLSAIARTWPGIERATLDEFTEDAVLQWASWVSQKFSPQFYNNIVGTAKRVFELVQEACGGPLTNPFSAAKRLGVKPGELHLPEPAQWAAFVKFIDEHPAGGEASKLIRLLAYAGLRISEAALVRWSDFDWERGTLRVHGAKGRASSSACDTRRVPIIGELRAFFEPQAAGQAADDLVCRVSDIRYWFRMAAKKLDFPHLSHHDLRHLFATRCIESGVDIPTVSRWLGHKDGGVLAMRVYGHLREDHSIAAAAKVTFHGP